mgnify:CR=1 FL=1
MKKIGKMVNHIKDEINDSMDYAMAYIEYKADGQSTLAETFHDMAQDELRHANTWHDLAVAVIDKVRVVYTPSKEMSEKWEACHQEYIAKAAEIKRILSL